jgi:hypothetical protein
MAHPINLVSGQALSNPFTNSAEGEGFSQEDELMEARSPEANLRGQLKGLY